MEAEAQQQRRGALVAMKLSALARDAGVDAATPSGFGGGAGLLAGSEAWVLLDDPMPRLGAALAWALNKDASSLVVLADSGTGQIARRAEHFDFPIRVFHVD